jgi:hypothetical protein
MRFMFRRGAHADGPALGQVSFPECLESIRTAVRCALRRPLVLLIGYHGPHPHRLMASVNQPTGMARFAQVRPARGAMFSARREVY